MRRVMLLLMLLALCSSLTTTIIGCGETEETEQPELPSLVVISTTGLGSSAHAWSSVLGDAFQDETGITVRLVPHGTDLARYTMLRDGDAHLVAASSINGWAPTFGLQEFSDWGPQPIYMIWLGSLLNTGVAVRADSGINSLADLAGKRVNNVPAMASINLGRDSHLAFAGLTPDDVILVDFPSYPAVFDGLKAGTVDAIGVVACTASGAYDVATSPAGIKWLEMPASDSEGWERLSEIAPYVPALATKGAGISEDDPLELSALVNTIYSYGTEVVSEELAYQWAKTLGTLTQEYRDRNPDVVGFTVENALNFQYSSYPYHPGTIRYFKEIGVWTSEHQEWQDSILAEMEARVG
mgnify:CR=1 FL=1